MRPATKEVLVEAIRAEIKRQIEVQRQSGKDHVAESVGASRMSLLGDLYLSELADAIYERFAEATILEEALGTMRSGKPTLVLPAPARTHHLEFTVGGANVVVDLPCEGS